MNPSISTAFQPLEQSAFLGLEQAASLKGLLKPFKGKGLEDWARQCLAQRDGLIGLAQQQVLPQAQRYPFSLLDVLLVPQRTSAGTTLLRWRKKDRSAMGVALWQKLISDPLTPSRLIDDLYAMEQQRLVLNMQVSLLHHLARQAQACANKLACAERVYRQSPHFTKESP